MEKIVVSGGTRGIGWTLVKKLLEQGHEVFTFGRDTEKVQQLLKQFPEYQTRLHVTAFNLESANFRQLADEIKMAMGTITRLVNNAGLLINKPFLDLTPEDVKKIFTVNVLSVFPLVQHLFPLMVSGTHIVNHTSMGGFQGSVKFPGLSAYSAAKGALAVLTESMAAEFSEYDIRVNALALGAVQTEMLSAAFPGYKAPLSPDEMADFMAGFLLTGHRYFNGKILPVSLSTP